MRLTVMPEFVFTFVLLCAWGLSCANEDELLCVRSHSVINGTQVSFLRRKVGAQPETFVLYSSLWDEDRQLVHCEANEDQLVVEHYLNVCGKTRDPVRDIPAVSYNISAILSPGSSCHGDDAKPEQSSEVEWPRSHRREKRAVIFPGTLWCGTGSKALEYHQLGMFQRTDECCREHDHCTSVIRSFTVNFGVFNHNLYTVSHCECDRRFRECLMEVNDAISHMVGYSFFSILKVPCFEFTLKKHCSKINWWGGCTKIEMAPYAVLQTQDQYNATSLSPKTDDHVIVPTRQVAIKLSTIKPSSWTQRKKPASATVQPDDCIPRGRARGDTFRPKLKKEHKQRCQKSKKKGRKFVPATTTTTTTTTMTTTAKSESPVLESISLTTARVDTLASKVKEISNAENNGPLLHHPKATSQPSVVAVKNTAPLSQVTTPQRQNNLTEPTQTTRAAPVKTTPPPQRRKNLTESTHTLVKSTAQVRTTPPPAGLYNQTQLLGGGVRPPRPPTQRPRCRPGSQPRGDTFLPGHPGGVEAGMEDCPESAVSQAEWAIEQNRRDSLEILHDRASPTPPRKGTAAAPLNEVTTPTQQARNMSAGAITSNDLSIHTTKTTPQGRKQGLQPLLATTFSNPTASQQQTGAAAAAAQTPGETRTRATQPPPITSPHHTKVATPGAATPEQIRAPSKQSTQAQTATAQRPEHESSRGMRITTRIAPQEKNSNSAVVLSSKRPNNPSGKILCGHLKDLDECAHKIPPFERRYGYHNNESKTVYHCDCTHRLSGHLRHQKNDARAIQFLLVDHVSLLCFGLQSSKHCSKSTRCSAVVFPATGLLVALRKMEYGGAPSKQQHPKRHKRTPVRLYKRCLKSMQSKLT